MFNLFKHKRVRIHKFFKNYFHRLRHRRFSKLSVIDPTDTKLIHQKIYDAFRDKSKLQIVIKSRYSYYDEAPTDYIVETNSFITKDVADTFIKVITDFDYGHLVNVNRISEDLIIIKIRKGKEQ